MSSKHGSCTKLYLITLFLRLNFLFNQMIIKTNTDENNKCKVAHIKKNVIILCENQVKNKWYLIQD